MNRRAIVELLNELRKELTAPLFSAQGEERLQEERDLRDELHNLGFAVLEGDSVHVRSLEAIRYLSSARQGDRKQLALAVEGIGQLEAEQKQILTAANQLARRVNTAVQALAGPLPGTEAPQQPAQDPGTPDGGEPRKPCKPCDEQRAAAMAQAAAQVAQAGRQ